MTKNRTTVLTGLIKLKKEICNLRINKCVMKVFSNFLVVKRATYCFRPKNAMYILKRFVNDLIKNV